MRDSKLHELKVARLQAQINTIKNQLDKWLEKDKEKRNALRQTLTVLESTLEDVQAIRLIVDKNADYGELCGYDTYDDYRINNYEYEFDNPDGEGYPDWWLEKEEYELLKRVYKRVYYL